jgi:hypothetical protein
MNFIGRIRCVDKNNPRFVVSIPTSLIKSNIIKTYKYYHITISEIEDTDDDIPKNTEETDVKE